MHCIYHPSVTFQYSRTPANAPDHSSHICVSYPGIIATQRLHTLLLGQVPNRHGERNACLFSNSYQHDPQKDRCDVKPHNSTYPLPSLHGRKVARSGVPVELDALNVDVAIVFRAPELE